MDFNKLIDELEAKSPSIFTIAQFLGEVCAKIQSTRNSTTVPVSNIDEDLMLRICTSKNDKISSCGCEVYVELAQKEQIPTDYMLQKFSSMIPIVIGRSKQFAQVADSIIDIILMDLMKQDAKTYVCNYGFKVNEHPFIMLLKCTDTYSAGIKNVIRNLTTIKDQEMSDKVIVFLQPVFFYLLSKNSLHIEEDQINFSMVRMCIRNKKMTIADIAIKWTTITEENHIILSEILINMIRRNQEIERFETAFHLFNYYLMVQLEVAEKYYLPKDRLVLAYGLLIMLLPQVQDVNFYNVTIFLCAKILHYCSLRDINVVARMIEHLMDSGAANPLLLYMIVDSLTNWVACRKILKIQTQNNIVCLIKRIKSGDYSCYYTNYSDENDMPFSHVTLAEIDSIAKVAISITKNENYAAEFIESISIDLLKNNEQFQLFFRALLLYPFSYSIWKKCFLKFQLITSKDRSFSQKYFRTYLSKLASKNRPEIQVELFMGLSNFCYSKENNIEVMSILKTLKGKVPKSVMALILFKMWKTDPSLFEHLFMLIQEPIDDAECSLHWDVIKTNILYKICDSSPFSHSKFLVDIIGKTLGSLDIENHEFAVAQTLNALVVLCKNNVINIETTWYLIKERFGLMEFPTRISEAICNFFGQVAEQTERCERNEDIYEAGLQRLWYYIEHSKNAIIVAAAIKALKLFKLETLTLRDVPSAYRQDLKIPNQYLNKIDICDTTTNNSVSSSAIDHKGDVLEDDNLLKFVNFIPGLCWTQLLTNITSENRIDVEDLISHHIETEIKELRGGAYFVPEGRREPDDWKSMHPKSIMKAVLQQIIDFSRNPKIVNSKPIEPIESLFKIIATKYSKPLPPLNWCFLLNVFTNCESLRKYCVQVAVNQVEISGTAKLFIEQIYRDSTSYSEEITDELLLAFPNIYDKLEYESYKQFAKVLINELTQDRSQKNTVTIISKLGEIIQKVGLKDDIILLIKRQIGEEMGYIDRNEEIMKNLISLISKFDCATIEFFLHRDEMDMEYRITNLLKLLEIVEDSEHIFHTLQLLFNEKIMNDSSLQSDVIKAILKLQSIRFLEKKDPLVKGFLRTIVSISQQEVSRNTEHLQSCCYKLDFFIAMVVILSQHDSCLIGNYDNGRLYNIFPQSLISLLRDYGWTDLSQEFYEFLFFVTQQIPSLRINLRNTIINALVCSKSILPSHMWHKFVGL